MKYGPLSRTVLLQPTIKVKELDTTRSYEL